MDRIALLEKHGGKIIEAYDEEKEFYVIDDAVCVMYRTDKWAELQDFTNLSYKAREEVKIQYHVILIAQPTHTLNDIEKTIRSIVNQTLLPKQITVLRHWNTPIPPQDIIRILNTLIDEKKNRGGNISENIRWRVSNITDGDCGDPVDLAIYSGKGQYYGVFQPGFELPPTLFSDLDNKINDEIFKFAALTPNKDGNGLIIPVAIHKLYSGNIGSSLLDKIKEDKWETMIHPISSIFPYFPE